MTSDSTSGASEIIAQRASSRRDVDRDERRAELEDDVSVPAGLASTMNALFAVGLDLAAVRLLVDDLVGTRIDGAIEQIDAIIVTLRTQAFASKREHGAVTSAPDHCRR